MSRIAALVVGVVLVAAACGDNASDVPSITQPSRPVATDAAPTTTEVRLTVAPETVASTPAPAVTTATPPRFEWTRVDFSDGHIDEVVAAGAGFAAVRYRSEGLDIDGNPLVSGDIVTSRDGREWTAAAPGLLAAGEYVWWTAGSARGAAGIVGAVDDDGAEPDVIASLDGRTWTRSSLQDDAAGWVGAVVCGEAGLIAVRYTDLEVPEGPTASLWWSEDGEAWAAVADAPRGVVGAELTASAVGYLLLGEPPDPGTPGLPAWWSADGQRWESVSVTDGIISGSGSATGWREGLLVARDLFDPPDTYGPHAWTSGDGKHWTENDPGAFAGLVPERFVGSSLGLAALASTQHDHEGEDEVEVFRHVLYSQDAVDWQRWRAIDLFGTDQIAGFAIGSDRLLVTVLDLEHSDVDTGEIAVDIWIGVLS